MSDDQTLTRPGRPSLRYRLHPPTGAVRGAVFLTHGYAEHSGRYAELVEALRQRGLLVAAHDLRGHGHSEGVRGHVDRFEEYLTDADDLLVALEKDPSWRAAGGPVLMGHSLGGLITFQLALRDPGRARGVVLSSPFFGLAQDIPKVKQLLGRLMSRISPAFSLPAGIKSTDLTHDEPMQRAHAADALVNPNATARWFTEATAAQADSLRRAPSMMLPILLLVAGEDRLASVAATKAVFDRIGSPTKELQVLPGQFHEIFNEVDRARFIALAADAAERFVGAAPPR